MPSLERRNARRKSIGARGLRGDAAPALLILTAGYLWLLLWLAASAAAMLSRAAGLGVSLSAPFLAFTDAANPSFAWGRFVAVPWLYWTSTVGTLTEGLGAVAGLNLLSRRTVTPFSEHPDRFPGVASRTEVKRAAGRRWLLRRAGILRPSLPDPSPRELGYRLGQAHWLECFCSVEDSTLIHRSALAW